MNQDINTVVIVGRITRDSELRYTASGSALCNFSVATNRRVKKGDEWQDDTSFIDLTLWNKQAEGLNKYLTKGTQVVIQGYLKQERWEKDGKTMSKLAVHVDDIQLVGWKREGQSEAPRSQAPSQSRKSEDFDPNDYPDDIPF
jgi:single-strand DNA-binding protein